MGEEVQMVRRSVVTGAEKAFNDGWMKARADVLKKAGLDPVLE